MLKLKLAKVIKVIKNNFLLFKLLKETKSKKEECLLAIIASQITKNNMISTKNIKQNFARTGIVTMDNVQKVEK